MNLLVLVSSLVGTIALLLDINVIAYVCGAVGLLDTLKKVALREESDKPFWMSTVAVVALASKPNFTWWQALLIVFLIKTLIMTIVFLFENLNEAIGKHENGMVFLTTRVVFDFITIIVAIIGSISLFFGINIIAYIGGAFVLINLLFLTAEGSNSSLTYIWVSIMIGISVITFNGPSLPWFLYTLSSICVIRTIKMTWRSSLYLIYRISGAVQG